MSKQFESAVAALEVMVNLERSLESDGWSDPEDIEDFAERLCEILHLTVGEELILKRVAMELTGQ